MFDDKAKGFAGRRLRNPEDAIGAEGFVGDMRFRFESILDLGRSQVVYALYAPERDVRIAYGFYRQMFEPKHEP